MIYNKHMNLCKNNIGVACDWCVDDSISCKNCGWNPEVEAARRNMIETEYNVKPVAERLEDIFLDFRSGKITRQEAHAAFDEMKISMLGSLKTVKAV